MYAHIAKAVGGFVVGGAVYAAGYVTANYRNKSAREKLDEENQRLRTQIRAYFAAVKEVNAFMEAAMADIAADPPLSRSQMIARLRKHGVTDTQISNILAAMDAKRVFECAA